MASPGKPGEAIFVIARSAIAMDFRDAGYFSPLKRGEKYLAKQCRT
jgi:hypothetical protein